MRIGRANGRTRRLMLSWPFAVVLIVAVLAGMVWFWRALDAQEHERAEQQARSIADVIAVATVRSHLDVRVSDGGGLSAADAADLRRDDHELRQAGRLSGVGIWRLDGSPLFVDEPAGAPAMAVTPAQLARARTSGASWTADSDGVGGASSVRVFLPSRPDAEPGGSSTWLIAIDVPRDTALASLAGQALRQQITLGIVVVLLLAGLLWLRRGLLHGERLARTDPLTRLPNRRALYEAAQRLLPAATGRHPAALLLIDLAEFKAVNDTLGHAAGDQLLLQVAATLRDGVREGDLVARLGGDEFAVLLTDLTDAPLAQLRAEDLLAALRTAPFAVHGVGLSVDASIGVALAPRHGRTVEELLRHADIAMYEAKRGHKGTMRYDESFDRHSVDRLEMVAELRGALERGEFVLHYQPKLSLPDRCVYGVEALVRWAHPTRGLLPPSEFLPLLESTGLIEPLTSWVLGEAVRQAATWRREGRPLRMAVNMSTRSLLSPALPATVLSVLAEAELPASMLELEITETAIMTNPEQAAHVLTGLRSHGIDISIDDFGAGYTSLAFLRILPVTALKMDRSLISRSLDSAADRAVTRAVVDLGHSLGLRIIAEGVESRQLLDALTDLGCDRAQGFAISHPVPAPDLERWLAAPPVGIRRSAAADVAEPTTPTPWAIALH